MLVKIAILPFSCLLALQVLSLERTNCYVSLLLLPSWKMRSKQEKQTWNASKKNKQEKQARKTKQDKPKHNKRRSLHSWDSSARPLHTFHQGAYLGILLLPIILSTIYCSSSVALELGQLWSLGSRTSGWTLQRPRAPTTTNGCAWNALSSCTQRKAFSLDGKSVNSISIHLPHLLELLCCWLFQQ